MDVIVDVFDEKVLGCGGFGGIFVVGGGLVYFLCLVCVEYVLEGFIIMLVLVGKGIIFDFGGFNIKIVVNMYIMKCDMGGVVVVFVVIGVIVCFGFNVCVVVYGCLVENMLFGLGWCFFDVVIMYDGIIVENGNFDVEGCIVMVDGLVCVCEDNFDFIVDIFILIGVCMVVFGNYIVGVMILGV